MTPSNSRPQRGENPRVAHFLYALDFDNPAVVTAETAPIQLTLKDIQRAEDTARQIALDEFQSASAFVDSQLRIQVFSQLGAAISASEKSRQELTNSALTCLAHTILAMTAAMLPNFCEKHGANEIIAIIKSLTPVLQLQPQLVLTVHESVIPLIKRYLQETVPEMGPSLVIRPTTEGHQGDLKVSWSDGVLKRSVEEIEAQLRQALDAIGLSTALPAAHPPGIMPPSIPNKLVAPIRSLELVNTD